MPAKPQPPAGAPKTLGAREALRGLALQVRSSEKEAPKGGLAGLADAVFSRRGAHAALVGVSLLGGAAHHVAQHPELVTQAQDLFERTAKPASAWLQKQAVDVVGRTGLSPLATLLSQRGAPAAHKMSAAAEASTQTKLLDAIESGRLTLDVPLRAGEREVQGVKVTIEPGTVLHVQVDVKDGKLVPRSDGEGTFATLNKPIDGPLFLTLDGAELSDAGGGHGALEVKLGSDWGPLLDINLGRQSLRLADLLDSFGGRGALGAGSEAGHAGGFDARELIDHDAVRFTVGGLTLKDGVLPASGLSLTHTSGELTLAGDRSQVTIAGDVGFDSLQVARPEGAVRFSAGSARVSVSASREGEGAVITTTVSDLQARIDEVALPSVGGKPSALKLDNGLVRGGDVIVRARTGDTGAVSELDVRADLEVSGRLADSQLRVEDDDGGATVRTRGGELSAQVKMRGESVEVDATLKDADLTLSSLQRSSGASSVDVERVRVKGDGQLQLSDERGLSLSLRGAEVDAVIADMRSLGDAVSTDLGRTTIAGRGDFRWSRAGGLRVEGDLRVNGVLDDLVVRADSGGSVLDLAPSSTLKGSLRRLSVGGDSFELEALTNVDLKLESSRLNAGAVALEGGGRIVGVTTLRIAESARGSAVRLDGDALIDLQVKDGHVRRGDELDADLGEGTRVRARLRSLELGDEVSLSLGSGSVVDAVLDGGSVRIGDEQIAIASGTRASFEVEHLRAGTDGQTELEGKLSLTVPFDAEMMKDIPGVTLLPAGSGMAQLTIGGVRMGADGSFSLSDLQLSLDAQAGKILGASSTGASPSASVESAASGVLSRREVSATTAARIVGVEQSESVRFDPMEVARRLQSGTLEVTVPMEGRVKKGAVAVRFEEGTELRLRVKIEDGRIVPGELAGTLSKPADGPLWVTVNGVRMSDSGSLKLDLGGFFDIGVPGMSDLPTDVEGFVARLQEMSRDGGEAARTSTPESSLFRFADARISVVDAALSPGPLSLPGGSVHLEAGSRASLSGNLSEGEAEVHVSFSALNLDEGDFAVKDGSGTAVVRTAYRTEDGQLRSRTTVEELRLGVEQGAHVSDNGDYLQLEHGHVAGTVTIEQAVDLDAQGRPQGLGEQSVDLALDVGGTLKGARVSASGGGGDAHLELGNTAFTGTVRIADSRIEAVSGHVLGLNASLHGLEVATPAGSLAVKSARVAGDGYVELTPDRVTVLDGSLVADVVVSAAEVGPLSFGGADVDVSDAELALRLDLSKLSRLEVATGERVPAGQRLKLDAELGLGARVTSVTGMLTHE